jgi:hypothetical protein
MEKIPTAEEFMRTFTTGKTEETPQEYVQDMLIAFAKLHVEAALKEASKKSKAKEGQITDYKLTNSILNSYPLENIK